VPLSAIPCLAYSKRSKPEENTAKPDEVNNDSTTETAATTTTGETQTQQNEANENIVQAKIIHTENEHLDNQQIKEYVEKRFEYEEFQGKRYKNQEAYNLSIVRRRQEREENRRNHREENKRRRKQARAEENSDERDDQDLPTLVKTCIEFKSREQKGRPSKSHTIYLQGKVGIILFIVSSILIFQTTVTILHEYCNRALKAQPIYEDVRDDLIR
jgi:Fe2+ transport system protein B